MWSFRGNTQCNALQYKEGIEAPAALPGAFDSAVGIRLKGEGQWRKKEQTVPQPAADYPSVTPTTDLLTHLLKLHLSFQNTENSKEKKTSSGWKFGSLPV